MQPLSDVSSARGAPMGRSDTTFDTDAAVSFEIERLRWVDGAYDQGGAYWGRDGKDYIYRAEAESEDGLETMFVRATNSEEARAAVLDRYPNASFAESLDIATMASAYIEAALWNTHNERSDDDDAESENLLDSRYALTDEAEQAMQADCEKFAEEHGDLIAQAIGAGYGIESVGYDLWMTRVGSGVGFSDRKLGDLGEELDRAASREGTVDLYIGDDDRIHKSGGCEAVRKPAEDPSDDPSTPRP